MILAVVFTCCLALALARAKDVWSSDARVIPWAVASELPVHLAHDFLGKYGLVKPSDDDILEYVNSVGITSRDVASGLRGLFTDPSLVLLEDDYGSIMAYYADTGLDLIDAYPETNAVFRSLLDASNAVALVYKPERFLLPSQRKDVANRFFSPTNFKLSEIDVGLPENVHVVDAPVVLRKFETPIHYPRRRSYNELFDIDRIPYAYKSPVFFRISDTASPYWYQAIDSGANPSYNDVSYPDLKAIHTVLGGKVTPHTWGSLCQIRPSWCRPDSPTVARTGDNAPPTHFEPETKPSYCRILGTAYPCVKYNRLFVNPVSSDSDKLRPLRFQPSTEQHIFKAIPLTASSVSTPLLPDVALKNVPFLRLSIPDSIPISDDIVAKIFPTTDIPIVSILDKPVMPPYFIYPEHLKAATVPVLPSGKPTVGFPSVSAHASVIPPYLIRPEYVKSFKAPVLATGNRQPVPTASVTPPYVIHPEHVKAFTAPVLATENRQTVPTVSVIPPYVIHPEHVKAITLPFLSTALPAVGTPSVSAVPSIILSHIRPDHLNAGTVPVISTPNLTVGIPSVSGIPSIIQPYIRPDHLNVCMVPFLSTAKPTVGTSPISVGASGTPPYVVQSEHTKAGMVPFLSTAEPTVGTSPISVDASGTPPYVVQSEHMNAGMVPFLSTVKPAIVTPTSQTTAAVDSLV